MTSAAGSSKPTPRKPQRHINEKQEKTRKVNGSDRNNLLHDYMEDTLSPVAKLEALLPDNPESSSLLVACRPADYSASAIAKAVEDCDTQLLGLAVTSMRHPDGRIVVALRVGARSPGAAARSLERYGYEVFFTRSPYTDAERQEAVARANELLHYLEL